MTKLQKHLDSITEHDSDWAHIVSKAYEPQDTLPVSGGLHWQQELDDRLATVSLYARVQHRGQPTTAGVVAFVIHTILDIGG